MEGPFYNKELVTIIKQKEFASIDKLQEELHSFLKKHFKNRVEKYLEWEAIGDSASYRLQQQIPELFFQNVPYVEALPECFNKLGFVTTGSGSQLSITVPIWNGEKEPTPAQKLVYQCNDDINELVEMEAEEFYSKLCDKIRKNEFSKHKTAVEDFAYCIDIPIDINDSMYNRVVLQRIQGMIFKSTYAVTKFNEGFLTLYFW